MSIAPSKSRLSTEELVATVQNLLLEDRLAVDKAIAAAVIVAQGIVVANTYNTGLLTMNGEVL